jgi:hypothetical protein
MPRSGVGRRSPANIPSSEARTTSGSRFPVASNCVKSRSDPASSGRATAAGSGSRWAAAGAATALRSASTAYRKLVTRLKWLPGIDLFRIELATF